MSADAARRSLPESCRGQERSACWQFSLRGLLSVMLCVAVLSGVWRIAPQLAIFVGGTISMLWAAWRLSAAIRLRRRRKRLAVACTLACTVFYVVSAGPAIAVTQTRPACDPIFETVYWPLERLCQREPIYDAVNWYLAYWRIPID